MTAGLYGVARGATTVGQRINQAVIDRRYSWESILNDFAQSPLARRRILICEKANAHHILFLEKRREMKTREVCSTISGYRGGGVWLKLVILVLLWIALPVGAPAQSSLVFPKRLTPAELGSTGFAIANSGAT